MLLIVSCDCRNLSRAGRRDHSGRIRRGRDDIENLKKEKEEELAQCIALKKAWKDVSFPTKKDGTPFKNMAKNFKNARYYIAYGITDCNYILKVNAVAEYKTSSEYISDELHCSETLKYMKNN